MTPRTYRPSRLDRVLWSFQMVIVVDGIDVVPYVGRARHLPWSEISRVAVDSTSPYAGGMYGAGSWVEVDISLKSGRGTGLQATRRPKSQRAAVEQVRSEIAAYLAAQTVGT
jgi:hypothetical protein